MLIATQTMLAMRCPECGRLEYHKLSRFDFLEGRTFQVRCSCGKLKLAVTKKGRGYILQVHCVVCGCTHTRGIKGHLLWAQEVVELLCLDTGIELGYIGPLPKVKNLAQNKREEMSSLFRELTSEDYFHNSEVMNRILTRVLELGERSLLSCQCGNYNIGIEIFPDRLELRCPKCGAVSVVYGETEEDIAIAFQANEIELTRNDITFLDEKYFTNR